MKLDELIIELRAKTDQLEASIHRVDKQMDSFAKGVQRNNKGLEQSFSRLGGVIGTYLGVNTVRAIAQTGMAFDRVNIQLKAATGSTEQASREFAFLREETNRLGLNTLETANAYAKLVSAARDTSLEGRGIRDVFTAVAEAASVMGLSATDTAGAIRALEQMISKGTVMSEEFKLQLGDRIPGATKIAAQALGVTTAEFIKMMENGEVITEEFLPKFAKGMRERFAGGVSEAADSARAAMGRFKNSWEEAANTIAQGGLLENIADAADSMAESLANPMITQSIADIANGASEATATLVQLLSTLGEWGGTLLQTAVTGFATMSIGAQNALGIIDDDVAGEALNGLRQRFQDLASAGKDAAGAMDDVGGKGGKGIPAAGKAAGEAAKNAEKLAEALRKLGVESNTEFLAVHMSDAEKAALDFDNAIDELTHRFGPLNEQQERYVRLLREQTIATANMKAAKKAAEEVAEEIKRQNERIAEAMNEPFINAARNIQNAVSDAIYDGLDNADDGIEAFGKSLYSGVKNALKRAVAEALTLQLLGPSLSGLSVGGLSGASGGSGISSLLSQGGGLIGNATGITSGITAAINGFGATTLGLPVYTSAIGPGVAAAGGAPMAAGAATGLAGYLGYAGLALTAAQMLGVFSGPRPHPASSFGTTGLDFRNANLQAKHMDTSTASSMAGALQQSFAAMQAAGLNLDFIQGLQGGVDDGTGFYSFGDWSQRNPLDTVTFDPNDADNGLARFLKLVLDASDDLSAIMDAELIPSLRELSTEGKTSAEVVEEIVKALTRDDLRKAFMQQVDGALLDQIIPGYAAMAQASAEHAANLARATELGVSQEGIARITALHQANVQRLLQQNDKTYQDSLRKAGELGRRFGQTAEQFGSILWSVRNGTYTPLSPTANLASLRGMVQSAGARAQLGDIAAQEELARLLPQFLELSGSVNGFDEEFEKDRALTESLAEAAQSVAERQAAIMENILAQAEEQTDILSRAFGGPAVSGVNANTLFQQAIASGQLDSQTAMNIIRASGFTGQFGNGNATAFFNSDMAANARALQAGAALGLPQFLVPGGTAANDNRSDIASLRSDVQTLIRVTAASGQLSAEQLAQLNSLTERMARTDELKWA